MEYREAQLLMQKIFFGGPHFLRKRELSYYMLHCDNIHFKPLSAF